MANSVRAWCTPDSPREVLDQLHRILASCRGGNKFLISTLCSRIAELQDCPQLLIEPDSRVVEIGDQWLSETFPRAGLGRLASNSDSRLHHMPDEMKISRESVNLDSGNMQQGSLQGTDSFAWESEMNFLSSIRNEEYG